jgi:AraC family transcriptional regulator, transcriptional activator of pobA
MTAISPNDRHDEQPEGSMSARVFPASSQTRHLSLKPGFLLYCAAGKITWLPLQQPDPLVIPAGCPAWLMTLDRSCFFHAIHNNPELEQALRILEQPLHITLNEDSKVLVSIQNDIGRMQDELSLNAPGSEALLMSLLTLVLVYVWRATGTEELLQQITHDSSRIVQRFQVLLEQNYRQRWTVYQYAEAIGVSTNRLYAGCKRETGMTPAQLIQMRILREARALLKRSAMGIDQISSCLGFKDSSHFSHFFKRHAAESPGHYRANRRPSAAPQPVEATEFTHWP